MQQQIKERTKRIGLDVIQLIDELPQKTAAYIIGRQLVRCSTSVGANYRAACRGKSLPDFINKLKIVEEEADETLYWFEMLEESGFVKKERLEPLKKETNEILSIVVSSIKTAQSRNTNPKSKI